MIVAGEVISINLFHHEIGHMHHPSIACSYLKAYDLSRINSLESIYTVVNSDSQVTLDLDIIPSGTRYQSDRPHIKHPSSLDIILKDTVSTFSSYP